MTYYVLPVEIVHFDSDVQATCLTCNASVVADNEISQKQLFDRLERKCTCGDHWRVEATSIEVLRRLATLSPDLHPKFLASVTQAEVAYAQRCMAKADEQWRSARGLASK